MHFLEAFYAYMKCVEQQGGSGRVSRNLKVYVLIIIS